MNMTQQTQPNVMANETMIPPPASQATTANEAAGLVFPRIAKHFNAFWEKEAGMNEAPSIELLDLNEDFWGLTVGPLGSPENPTVFVASEDRFRRYNQTKGIYEPISESAVISQIMGNLELCAEFLPHRVQISSFLALNRTLGKPMANGLANSLTPSSNCSHFVAALRSRAKASYSRNLRAAHTFAASPMFQRQALIGVRREADHARVNANARSAADQRPRHHSAVCLHQVRAGIGVDVGHEGPTDGRRVRVGRRHRALELEVAVVNQLYVLGARTDVGQPQLGWRLGGIRGQPEQAGENEQTAKLHGV
jgi:hypothetical protein